MVRKLKHHEQKLLRKVDFITYKSDANHHASSICRRYTITNPSDYTKYNRICGSLRQLAHGLSNLAPDDPIRIRHEKLMMEKLYDMGILSSVTKLSEVERKVGVSRMARRRLGVVMTRLGMAENVTAGVKFIEQGHVRVGTEVVTDPAFLVVSNDYDVWYLTLQSADLWEKTRNMEDFVTWVDSSKVKRNILKYRDKLDDFDLL